MYIFQMSSSDSDDCSPQREWRPRGRRSAPSTARSIAEWASSFPQSAWETLRAAVGSLPQQLREALSVNVDGSALPVGLVLAEAAPPVQVPDEEAPTVQVVVRVNNREVRTSRDRSRSPIDRPETAAANGTQAGRMCPICNVQPDHMRRHVEQCHLPYWLHGDAACFACGLLFETAAGRRDHDGNQHAGRSQSIDSAEQYQRWILSMADLVEWLAVQLGSDVHTLHQTFLRRGWCPPRSSGVHWHQAMECMLQDVARAMDLLSTSYRRIDPANPQLSTEILHWRTLLLMLTDNPHLQVELRDLPLRDIPPASLSPELGAPVAVDSHCHLSSYVTMRGGQAEDALSAAMREALDDEDTIVPALTTIVDNRVFRREWAQEERARCGFTRVVYGYGVHPKERINPDWEALERRISGEHCVVVGECGLDHTCAPETEQRQVSTFQRQLQLAMKYGKPVVLHLRPVGRNCHPVLQQAVHVMRCVGFPNPQDSPAFICRNPRGLHLVATAVPKYRLWDLPSNSAKEQVAQTRTLHGLSPVRA